MASYLNRLLERIVIVQQAAVASVTTSDAVPYFYHTQEDFPYFTNRISDNAPDTDSPADLQTRAYTVTMRLVVAHLTAGYVGENEALLYELIPLVETAFSSDQWLASDDGSVIEELDAVGVQFSRSRGMTVFSNAGIEAQQLGTEFTLRASFDIDLYPRY